MQGEALRKYTKQSYATIVMMISAIVLTHNDEATIELTLKSIQWCGDIVVVDDNSTDASVEIAKKFTSKIFVHTLQDDFSSQRNFGLSKAKGPASRRRANASRGEEWVLFVDSDEVVTKELAEEIRTTVHRSELLINSHYSGYYIKRKDFWGGRWLTHGETANVRLLRLAKKNAGIWVQPVHETWNVKGSIGELTYPLLHYPHPNVAQFLYEINRYSSMYATYLYKRGIREPWWHIIVKPKLKFFHNYLIRLGFLDGTAGAVVAIMMSFHSFLVRGKLWLLWHKVQRNNMS